ncbi:MAG TPA: hypothetical protein VGJ95_00005, partial [Pseudonocardiaceae bacterium]
MTDQPVLAVPDARVIRDELQRLVLADLLGPLGGEREEFQREDPLDRYPLGRLAPRGAVVEPDTQDDLADAEVGELAEGDREPSAPNTASLALASIGFTATVSGRATELRVTAKWARYERVTVETEGSGPDRVWRRVPMGGGVTVPLAEGVLPAQAPDRDLRDVVVRGRARRHGGDWLVSLFLENQQPQPQGRGAGSWIFQVELSAAAPDGAEVFLPRPDRPTGGDESDKAEQRRLAMVYRFEPEFAVGHGAAVHAERRNDTAMTAVRVSTSTVPQHEMPATDVPDAADNDDLPELADVELDMAALGELADGPPERLLAALRPLVTGYRNWIEARATEADDPGRQLDGYRAQVTQSLDAAQHLGCADQRGRAFELLDGQQPQRVPHEHGDAKVGAEAGVDRLQPAHRQGEGGEAEVGLGLAAAGGEPQQVGDGPLRVVGALGVAGVGQRRQVEQDERELKRPPPVVVRPVQLACHVVEHPARVGAAGAGHHGVDALHGHRPVGEAEGAPGDRIGTQEVDADLHP